MLGTKRVGFNKCAFLVLWQNVAFVEGIQEKDDGRAARNLFGIRPRGYANLIPHPPVERVVIMKVGQLR